MRIKNCIFIIIRREYVLFDFKKSLDNRSGDFSSGKVVSRYRRLRAHLRKYRRSNVERMKPLMKILPDKVCICFCTINSSNKKNREQSFVCEFHTSKFFSFADDGNLRIRSVKWTPNNLDSRTFLTSRIFIYAVSSR